MKGADRMVTLLRARIEEMSVEQARARIGEAAYVGIRREDAHPMFVELLAGHEGWSSGQVVSGSRGRPARKHWSRERIVELAAGLGLGAPVYAGHARPGARRRAVGRMVSAAERWFRGVMGAAGIAYIADAETRSRVRSGELNTCSIEAEVELHRGPSEEEGSWVVDAVRKVTGVALGDARRSRPGFPGAALLAVVEEFAEEPEPEPVAPAAEPRLPAEATAEAGAAESGGALAERRLEELGRRVGAGEKRVEELTAELKRLREGWSPPRIAAPPERERDPMADNPLIPRPGGF
jgi:hypothetical protein